MHYLFDNNTAAVTHQGIEVARVFMTPEQFKAAFPDVK
jgi:hypothetical protein